MEEFAYLVPGIVFGLTAGLSPGPLMTLVISQTLKHGKMEGIKVGMAPLFTDLPIILLSVFLLSRFSGVNVMFGTISIIGGLFIGYLALESFTTRGVEPNAAKSVPSSLRKAILVNFTNPHPYIFFISVGGPIIVKGLQQGFVLPALFIVVFLSTLVVSKIVIALLADRSRSFLTGKIYLYTMKVLGIVLLVFALNFLQSGLRLLEVMI